MPELPEVETIVRGLRPCLIGRRILDVRLGKTDFIDDPVALAARMPGSRILGVERLGKLICIRLLAELHDAPAGERFDCYVHLGMTGQLIMRQPSDAVSPHTHIFVLLDDGKELRYTDIRRFGRVSVVPESASESFHAHLGVEPLESSLHDFYERFGSRRARVKALLLDQRVLRGVGNIYADESLFRARIHPARIAATLTRVQIATLRRAVRDVLTTAIRLRGSSVSDYLDSRGIRGEFQNRHKVYQRTGKPCTRCGEKIQRVIVAGRSSHFCPKCQPAPRRHKSHSITARRKQIL
jgi:formamidopyrimidine-DNA glycosylase